MAFESTFHSKYSYADFLQTTVLSQSTKRPDKDSADITPSNKLKKYSKFLNSFVFDFADVNQNVVHSYRSGRNVRSTLAGHAENKFFFKTDIKNFFSSVGLEDITKVIDKNLSTSPISDIASNKDIILNLTTMEERLPIGIPTSPNISNSCLLEFDNIFENFCEKNEILYTRYSDDIILSSSSRHSLIDIDVKIQELLSGLYNNRFQLNRNKTKHTHSGNKVKFLGLVILPNGSITVDKNVKTDLETLFYFFKNDKEKYQDFFNKKYQGNDLKVHGLIHYINVVDELYVEKLRRKYGNLVVDTFYSRPES